MEEDTGASTRNYSSPSIIMPIYFYKNFDIQEDNTYLFAINDVSKFIQNMNHYIYLLSKRVKKENADIISPIHELSERVERGLFLFEGGLEEPPMTVIDSREFSMLLNHVADEIIPINQYEVSVVLRFKKGNPNLSNFYFKLIKKNSDDKEAFLTTPQSLAQISRFQ
jgi:hypothetical protein